MTTTTTQRTALYRLFAGDGTLLYVGITNDPKRRWAEHSDKGWRSQVFHRELEWFPSRAEAEHAETNAIRAERPLYNRAKSLGRRRVGKGVGSSVSEENYPHQTPEQMDILSQLDAATAGYEEHYALRNESRERLHQLVARALRAEIGPSEVTRRTPYDRQHIARIRMKHGIPAKPKPGQVSSEETTA